MAVVAWEAPGGSHFLRVSPWVSMAPTAQHPLLQVPLGQQLQHPPPAPHCLLPATVPCPVWSLPREPQRGDWRCFTGQVWALPGTGGAGKVCVLAGGQPE